MHSKRAFEVLTLCVSDAPDLFLASKIAIDLIGINNACDQHLVISNQYSGSFSFICSANYFSCRLCGELCGAWL